jgi:hypothetical protein
VHFKKFQVEYANNYCWVSGTYYHPFNGSVPDVNTRYKMNRTMYYQWVPIILLVQALLFNVPCILWRSLVEHSGLDINSVVVTGQMLSTVQMTGTIRDGLLQRMVVQINRYLGSFDVPKLHVTLSIKHIFSTTCFVPCGHQRGNYLLSLYLIIKLLYVLNALGQLFALNIFLGQDYHTYGADVIQSAANGDDWTGSYRFPRVNLCDFKIRRLGNVHQHTLQCVLPVNLFNEKIFLFLWFWLIFLAFVTLLSLVVWIIRSAIRIDRTRFIKRHLQLSGDIETVDDQELKKRAVLFVEKHLCQDGVFLLRLFQKATNQITAVELTSQLWKTYLKQPQSNGFLHDTKPLVPHIARIPTAPHPKEVDV